MAARYGMDAGLGHVSYDTDRPGFLGSGDQNSWLNRRYSEATAERMYETVKALIDDVFACAVRLIEANRALLEVTASDLLERETLDDEDLVRIRERVKSSAESKAA